MADTLRLEVEPLGVTVLCVLTGGVKTAGQTYFDDLKLPEVSLYKEIEGTIISRAQGHDGMIRMEVNEYAEAVADQIEACTSGKFWYGTNAEMVRQATTAVAVPQAVFVSSLPRFRVTLILSIVGLSNHYGNRVGRNEEMRFGPCWTLTITSYAPAAE